MEGLAPGIAALAAEADAAEVAGVLQAVLVVAGDQCFKLHPV